MPPTENKRPRPKTAPASLASSVRVGTGGISGISGISGGGGGGSFAASSKRPRADAKSAPAASAASDIDAIFSSLPSAKSAAAESAAVAAARRAAKAARRAAASTAAAAAEEAAAAMLARAGHAANRIKGADSPIPVRCVVRVAVQRRSRAPHPLAMSTHSRPPPPLSLQLRRRQRPSRLHRGAAAPRPGRRHQAVPFRLRLLLRMSGRPYLQRMKNKRQIELCSATTPAADGAAAAARRAGERLEQLRALSRRRTGRRSRARRGWPCCTRPAGCTRRAGSRCG